jgi:hypothetical protein
MRFILIQNLSKISKSNGGIESNEIERISAHNGLDIVGIVKVSLVTVLLISEARAAGMIEPRSATWNMLVTVVRESNWTKIRNSASMCLSLSSFAGCQETFCMIENLNNFLCE